MFVKITRTVPVAPDGIHVRKFTQGQKMEVSDELFRVLKSLGAAEIISAEAITSRRTIPQEATEIKPSETAVETEAPEAKGSIKVFQLSDETGVASSRIVRIAKSKKINISGPDDDLTAEQALIIKSSLEKQK